MQEGAKTSIIALAYAFMELIATCAFGLEKLVYQELKDLGIWVIKTEDGKVTFEGDWDTVVKANLWLRCSERILIKMGEFQAETFDELFDEVAKANWSAYIGQTDSFPIQASAAKSTLHSEPAIQSIVKKSIVKNLQKAYGQENLPENSGRNYQIVVKFIKNICTIGIDTSGESLHKRGYRLKANLAPIKETLAAALIKLSDWTPDRLLVDPFCGSGTILIEAALIAKNIPPGLYRQFTCHQWPHITPDVWRTTYEEARAAQKLDQPLKIEGYDLDPHSIEMAGYNLESLALEEEIRLTISDFKLIEFSKFENAVFITNPPYGERISEQLIVGKIYKDLGEKFRQTKNSSFFLITPDEIFPKLFGRPADKNRKLFNGRIKCYLYQYFKQV